MGYEMLSVLFLVPLWLCNAQWPLQSVGHEDVGPVPTPPDQPGYPYDKALHFVEMPHNPNLKLPENADQMTKILLKISKFPNDPASSEEAKLEEIADQKTNRLVDDPDVDKVPSLAVSSNVGRNVTQIRTSAVRDVVNNLVNKGPALRNETDLFMEQLNLLYLNLAVVESDNEVRTENAYKYGMSVILRFLLEFYRIFRKLSSQSTQLRITAIDVYGLSYDKAVDVMKDKKEYTPLQISAPVRRSADILKTILYESVIIVQTKCSALDPNWKCIILYLANLISEAMNCSNIWYHAFIHMLALETKIGESFVYKIADLDKFKDLIYFDNIFDFIIEKLQEYREIGRVQLSAEAVFFTMLADLHENGLLDCISINKLYNR